MQYDIAEDSVSLFTYKISAPLFIKRWIICKLILYEIKQVRTKIKEYVGGICT